MARSVALRAVRGKEVHRKANPVRKLLAVLALPLIVVGWLWEILEQNGEDKTDSARPQRCCGF